MTKRRMLAVFSSITAVIVAVVMMLISSSPSGMTQPSPEETTVVTPPPITKVIQPPPVIPPPITTVIQPPPMTITRTPTTTAPPPTTTTTPPPTTTTPPPTTTTQPAGVRLFNGDYSTGNFSQWPGLQCRSYNSSGSGWPATGNYQAQIVDDPVKGKAARYEVRSGDWPGFATGERSEVQGATSPTGGTEGQARWYSFSTKFDPTFPLNHADQVDWAVTNQWHPTGPNSGPVLYWEAGWDNGKWDLVAERQAAGGGGLGAVILLSIPIDRGNWHDVKMEVKWSGSDTIGYVRLWLNGVRQTFVNGSDTYFVRTMIPGDTGVYYKEGYYSSNAPNTRVVYHTGFHSAASESGLG